jgi:hypothetical protein
MPNKNLGLVSQGTSKPKSEPPRITYATLLEKIEAARGELESIDSELRDLVDAQNELHQRLIDLEDLVVDLEPEATSSSFPVFQAKFGN